MPSTRDTPPLGLMDQGWAEPGISDVESYTRSLETIRFADEIGIDTAWIGEHHFARPDSAYYGRIPASEVFLAYAAAQTRRIRLGTGVKILSTTTAMRAAEEMAVLNVLSGGRAEFGLGLGSTGNTPLTGEEKALTFQRMLDELLTIFGQMEGPSALSPAPLTDMSTCLWAAARDDSTLDYLARNNLNLVVGQAELAVVQAGYVRRYRQSGGQGRTRGVRLVFVAPTREEAFADSKAAADLYYSAMANKGYHAQAVANGLLSARVTSREDINRQISFIVGSPVEVASELNDYIATTGVEQIDAMVQIPRLKQEHIHRSVELLQMQVRPKLHYRHVSNLNSFVA